MAQAQRTAGVTAAQDKRALLAERLRQAAVEPSRSPLSFAQQRLWFLDQLEPNSPLYNLATVVRLIGTPNLAALEQALNAIIARHEALRTRFICPDERPEQVVDPQAAVQLRVVDLAGPALSAREAEAQKLIREEVNRPFNLSADRLLRATLLRLKPDEHRLILVLHHIVSDEWSIKVMFRELAALYEGFVLGKPATLPPLPIQHADYTVWQRDWLRGQVLEKQLAYWRQQLDGSPPITELPTDHPRRSMPSFRGANHARALGPELTAGLKQLAVRQKTTLFMVLLAGFKVLLRRYTRQEDIIVGSPIAGRNRVETEGLIGFFVNTLLLRTRLAGNPTFEELLASVRTATLGAYAHQDLPFDKLVEELQPERSLNHLPFTKVMFVLRSEMLELQQLPGLRLEFLEVESDTAKFDLTLFLQETARGLVARAEYNRDLFEAATIARLLGHFETLLRGAVAAPDRRLSELPLLTQAERRQLLVEWNDTAAKYPRDKCIHELFDLQAQQTPEATAVVFGPRAMTYAELNACANHLAHYLRQFQVGPDVPVAICVHRSLEMVVGLLAILKAGGAYVPLDTRYPKERLAFMLGDTQAPVLLTQQSLLGQMPPCSAKVICLDADWELIARESRLNPPNLATAESLAYIMYTSGSTGQPKGVAVPHRAVNRLVLNTNFISLDATDRVAQVSNVSFDAATFEIWGALLNGAQLVGITRDVALSPHDFACELREQGVTAMFLTAALFHQLAGEVPGAFETLRTLMAGGEALDPKWVRAVLRQRAPQRLVNGYGPTENTTFTCCHHIRELPTEVATVPIGRPIANTQVYILDPQLNPVPIGVPGELYTGGDGLARGYWNRPELTAEKFIPNPFRQEAGPPGAPCQFLYRTGDLARFRPGGAIEFLGRMDHQVKIRGFRIELGEVETALGRHPGVRECVVTVRGTESCARRLVAYLVPSGQPVPNASQLHAFLGERLPDYMVPSAFVLLEALPLTPNGKVDRRALPAPDEARPKLEREYVAPRDKTERQLARIWEAVLDVRPIGVADKFFDLGGHSLLAVRVIAQIEKVFGKKLRLATIFQAPTIEQLAAILREEIQESAIAAATSLVEVQAQGSRPPLYLVHGAGGGMFWGYANLARRLGPDQPVFGFKSRGLDGREEFSRIEDLAAQYVADLQARQPYGPYCLGGYCFGGNVAYEMARQLCAQGEDVTLLALLNCSPPNSRYTRIPWTPLWGLRLLRNLGYWANYFRQWSGPQRREFFRWKWSLLKQRLTRLLGGADAELDAVHAGDLVDLSSYTADQRSVWEAHIHALVSYCPQPYPGRVHLFRSPGHSLWCSFDPDYGWSDLAKGGVEITVLPGAHEKLLEEPCVEALAAELAKALDELRFVGSASSFSSPSKAGAESSSSPFSPSSSGCDEESRTRTTGGLPGGSSGAGPAPPGLPAPSLPAPSPLPASFLQEQLWFFDQLEPGSHAFNVPTAFRLKGRPDVGALQRACNEVIRRHEALRTTFHYADGNLAQVVAPSLTLEIRVLELRGVPPGEREQQAQAAVNAEAQQPFDLARGPLLRAALVRLDEADHAFVVVMHQSISDGWSMALFFEELEAFYNAFVRHQPAPQLPEPEVQYADFAHWQRQEMQGPALEQELAYWKKELAGAPAALELPADHPEPDKPTRCSARFTAQFSEPVAQAAVEFSQREGGTPFITLMSALAVALHKWTGQQDLVIGTVAPGRNRRELEKVIGCFMTSPPVRIRFPGARTARDIVARVRRAVLEGQSHQDCPFEKIVEVLNPERKLHQNPLYNVELQLQNFPAELFRGEALEASPMPAPMQAALLDLRFEAKLTAQGLSMMCEYRTDLFEAATIEQFLGSFQQVLETLASKPQARLADFEPAPALAAQAAAARARKEKQTVAVAATFTAEPLAEPLRCWMEELELSAGVEFAPYNQVFQQLLAPDSLLAANPRGLNVLLLRLEDWRGSAPGVPTASPERANRAAAAGEGPGAPSQAGSEPDGQLRRTIAEFTLALKAAAARSATPYLVCLCPPSSAVAADPAQARALAEAEKSLAADLAGLNSVYLLTTEDVARWYPVADYYDPSGEELGHVPYTPVFFTALATVVARIFHARNRPPCKVIVLDCDQTLWSGVCGEDGPLGIQLDPPRQALQEFMRAQQSAGKLLCVCSKNNEADVREVFARRLDFPLRAEHFAAWRLNWQPKSENLKGLARELQLGLDSFILLDDNPVECAEVEANCPQVLTLQLPEDPNLIPRFLQHCWAFDQLRTTVEDRARSEFYRHNQQRERFRAQAPSLADFLAGLELKIAIEPMQPSQLARVAQLTQRTNQFNAATRRFTEAALQRLLPQTHVLTVQVSDRFGDYGLVGVIICKPAGGDLEVEDFLLSCRVLGRGVEYRMLARLGELARARGLAHVDVHFTQTGRNNPALDFLDGIGAAFRQPSNGGYRFRFPAGFAAEVAFQPSAGEPVPISDAAAQPVQSPVSAPVRKFVRCRAIALEANDPLQIHQRFEARTGRRPGRRSAYSAPRTDLERQLCELWQGLLHLDRVGIHDDFFELGGHSLLAVRLFAEIEKLTGRKFPLVTLFQASTVAQLAEVLDQGQSGPAHSLLVPIQPRGNRPPLFLVHGAGGDVLWGYANLAAHLSPDQPIYGIKSHAQAGSKTEVLNLVEMAGSYLQAVRAFQPHGPYYLGGYCFGGNVAYEMARQLQLQGQGVALVALLDSAPGRAGYETIPWWRPGYYGRFARNCCYWLADFAALAAPVRRRFVIRKLRALGRKVKRRFRLQPAPAAVDLEEVIEPSQFPEHELRLWRAHLRALDEHADKPYPSRVLLLRTRGQPLFCSLEEDFCWSRLALGGVTVRHIPGSHENIFMEPNVRILAQTLGAALAQAQQQAEFLP